MIQWPPCCLLPCAWPVRDSRSACAAARRRCRSGPRGVTHASHKGAAEGTEDFVHKGRVCCLGLCLSANGGLAVARPVPPPRSGGSRRRGTGWAQWGSLPSAPGWLPTAAGGRGRIFTSLTIPWCVASGAAPTARSSRGHGPGAKCRPSPTRWLSGGPGAGLGVGG